MHRQLVGMCLVFCFTPQEVLLENASCNFHAAALEITTVLDHAGKLVQAGMVPCIRLVVSPNARGFRQVIKQHGVRLSWLRLKRQRRVIVDEWKHP